MNRVSLEKRLRALDVGSGNAEVPIMDITLQGYINMLREQVPNSSQEVYRLLRCADIGIDVHATLAEVVYRVAEQNELGNRIIYDVMIGPLLRIMEEQSNGK